MVSSSDQLSVIKSEGTLVLPFQPTPTHTLPFSSLDKMIAAAKLFINVLFVYKHGPKHPAEVIKKALAKALVPYYPLAGRLEWSEQGELTGIVCTGDGVWFVDAWSDCILEDLISFLELPPSRCPIDQLLPSHPNPVGMSIMLQVTRLTRGGFVVGLKIDHSMADGLGVAQIMKAVGEIARGFKQPTVEPIWSREYFPNVPLLKLQIPPATNLEHLIIDVPQDHIDRVKGRFMELTGERCSTFDVVVAQLWQCRTRAIQTDPSIHFSLKFPVNDRSRMSRFFPDGTNGGYYGNCVYSHMVSACGGTIVGSSIVEVVALIKNAKKRSAEDISKREKGGPHYPIMTVPWYDDISVSDWTNLGLYEVDYGWGEPVYITGVQPLKQKGYLLPMCIVIKPPYPMVGRRLITRCIRSEHYKSFYDQMVNFSTNKMDKYFWRKWLVPEDSKQNNFIIGKNIILNKL